MNLYDYHENPDQLKGHHEKHDLVPEFAWEQIEKNKKATPKQEDAISKNAEYSYTYSKDVIKGPFPKGEDAISKNSDYENDYEKKFGTIAR